MEKTGIKWHQGFYGGIELELRDYREYLTYSREVELGKAPIRADMLIIKNETGIRIDNPIGRIFSKYNIVEYKSPMAGLSVDDLYKAISYACLYKSLGNRVNERHVEDITVSLFRHRRPTKLFKTLVDMGATVEKAYDGVYYISGIINFSIQTVVMGELEKGEHTALTILTHDADASEERHFIDKYYMLESPSDISNIDAVLRINEAANGDIFQNVEGGKNMHSEMIWKVLHVEEFLEEQIQEQVDARLKNQMYSLVHDGKLSLKDGAETAGLTEAVFTANMNEMYMNQSQTATL